MSCPPLALTITAQQSPNTLPGRPWRHAFGALAMAYSFQVAIALLAAIYVLDMLATVFLIPELKGKELH